MPKDVADSYEMGLIDGPGHSDFEAVYQCYLKVFTLPSEQESKANFEKILANNADPHPAAKTGKEMWVYLKDKQTGRVVGASNFDAFVGSETPGIDGTLHGIYTFVDPEFRQNGIVKQLVAAREEATKDFIRQSITPPPRPCYH